MGVQKTLYFFEKSSVLFVAFYKKKICFCLWKISRTLMFEKQLITVKLVYNELGFNEHSVIMNKNIYLVGLGHFYDKFSRL